ncbi:hypothetical protein DW1_1138 [Proteiniborus sp. DW1]|uniref:hypothetical protein n=1 Tax=Proteiniborus sp. DW1 TaxID=1889883 RepID=UPI00092DFD78|nr:hypothetical protein [Proteiniborus sp. DW1]SCG82711.1 hypothetical protein DW1_1138 [Proteiniborus sp. DW1]
MNRTQRRKTEKNLKKIMTDKQLKNLKEDISNEFISKKVEERFNHTWEKFGTILLETMREFRISQERINQIVTTAYNRLEEELKGAGKNEGLSKCSGNE